MYRISDGYTGFIFYALKETARYMSGLPMTCRAEFTNIKSTQRQDLPKSIMLLYSLTLKNFYQWTRLFIEKSALKSGNMAPRLDPRLRALLSKTFFGHHELATFNPQILRSDFALTRIYEHVNLSFPRRRESSREATFLDSRLRGNDKYETFWTVVRLRGNDKYETFWTVVRLRGNDKYETFWTVVRLRGDDNWH